MKIEIKIYIKKKNNVRIHTLIPINAEIKNKNKNCQTQRLWE